MPRAPREFSMPENFRDRSSACPQSPWASEALLREAARTVDAAGADLTDDTATEASTAVAAAKVQAARTAVETAGALFEVSGARSALNSLNLHRHWRDARTHTLHEPARWKIQHIGRYELSGTRPPRHGLLQRHRPHP
jgi:alkylation response protein AidB-like acyl-CoA dehydrogenase